MHGFVDGVQLLERKREEQAVDIDKKKAETETGKLTSNPNLRGRTDTKSNVIEMQQILFYEEESDEEDMTEVGYFLIIRNNCMFLLRFNKELNLFLVTCLFNVSDHKSVIP